jgi:hypothetical protein
MLSFFGALNSGLAFPVGIFLAFMERSGSFADLKDFEGSDGFDF